MEGGKLLHRVHVLQANLLLDVCVGMTPSLHCSEFPHLYHASASVNKQNVQWSNEWCRPYMLYLVNDIIFYI